MPDFATTYANYCGVKLPKTPPKFPTLYFPIPDGDYITFHSGAGHPSRVYSYFSDVAAMIMPFLKKKGIKVLQIGSKKDIKVIGAIDMRGECNIRQSAFLLEKSKLHIGSDSLWSHVAGAFNIPSVILFSPNPKEVTMPHYRSDKFYALEPDRKGKRHSYSVNESPRLINEIKPEVIAQTIISHFGFEENIGIETIRIGDNYKIIQYDFVPDCPFKLNVTSEKLVCRLDIAFNLKNAATMLNKHKCVIVTKQPIDPRFIEAFKHNIDTLVYKIEDKVNIDFVEYIDNLGIEYMLITDIKDEEIKSKLKLDLFDFNDLLTIETPDGSFLQKEMLFKTNRVVFGRGTLYDSIYHYKNADNSNFGKARKIGDAINDKDFLSNLESYYIYKTL